MPSGSSRSDSHSFCIKINPAYEKHVIAKGDRLPRIIIDNTTPAHISVKNDCSRKIEKVQNDNYYDRVKNIITNGVPVRDFEDSHESFFYNIFRKNENNECDINNKYRANKINKNTRKQKLKSKLKLKNLRKQINEFGNKLNNPNNDSKLNNIDTHSWFDIKESNKTQLFKTSKESFLGFDEIENDGYFTKKLKIFPTKRQQYILLNWLDCYINMYNATTKYFKKCRFERAKVVFSLNKLKKLMKNEKDIILNNSVIKMKELQDIPEEENDRKLKDIYVDAHLLDYAINDALKRLVSCLTNLRNGNIRHFRLRYLKHKKPNKIFKMEHRAFSKNGEGFYVNSLGRVMKCEDRNFNYVKNVNTVVTLKYDKTKNEFITLFKYEQPKLENEEPYVKRKEIISLDPGIRTFMTGYGSDGTIEIGTSEIMQKEIKRRLKLIDKINNNKFLTKSKKRIAVAKRQKRIKNLIRDSHWKSADYLTKKYKTVVIGNFSTKSMGEKNDVNKMTKRIGNAYSMFQFKQILQYKCFKTGTNYKHIDEAYTSKCCSRCGYYNKLLKGEKIYECKQCKLKIQRDINGAKNILILSLGKNPQ